MVPIILGGVALSVLIVDTIINRRFVDNSATWHGGGGARSLFATLSSASVGFPVVLGDLDFLQHKLSDLVLLFFLERPLLLAGTEMGGGRK